MSAANPMDGRKRQVRTAWLIVVGTVLAALSLYVGAAAVSSLLVDAADRAVVEPAS
ncbi:hypothetical protein ACH3VR_09925 [Microbacterium sp. B2969]|uniref:Uncharacterized protein n=1 Tax=Microbacterium alkaliflavum TaxID=3248839 RepID=A0ABW7Q729_9MICO